MTTTPRDWEGERLARQAAVAAYVATWPTTYATVREAVGRGFWPDCYGGGPAPHGCQPPTKFGYAAGWIEHPLHVAGLGGGAGLWVWSFEHDDPDTLRDREVWHAGATWFCPMLDGYRLSRDALTFDAALAYVELLDAYLRAHYLVPRYTPDTRYPILTGAEWVEVANVPLAEDAPPEGQLALFTPTAPTTTLGKARSALQALLVAPPPFPDTAPVIISDPYRMDDLIAVANRVRRNRLPEHHAQDWLATRKDTP